jgi:hypothetical protein
MCRQSGLADQVVLELIRADAAFARAIMNETASDLCDIVELFKNHRLRPGIERLAEWMVRSDQDAGGTGRFVIPYDKRTLASISAWRRKIYRGASCRSPPSACRCRAAASRSTIERRSPRGADRVRRPGRDLREPGSVVGDRLNLLAKRPERERDSVLIGAALNFQKRYPPSASTLR